MKAQFELVGGGALSVAEMDGERAVVEAARAFPPGSTLEFSSRPSADAGSGAIFHFKVKVRSCRRSSENSTFRMEGRFVSLSREAREFLSAAL